MSGAGIDQLREGAMHALQFGHPQFDVLQSNPRGVTLPMSCGG